MFLKIAAISSVVALATAAHAAKPPAQATGAITAAVRVAPKAAPKAPPKINAPKPHAATGAVTAAVVVAPKAAPSVMEVPHAAGMVGPKAPQASVSLKPQAAVVPAPVQMLDGPGSHQIPPSVSLPKPEITPPKPPLRR